MTGHDYEYLVARYLRNNGYTSVKVTKGSGDYGVDVVAHKRGKKYAVQCKHYTGPVGLSAVQEAVAGKAMYKCDSAMVVTNSTFTNAARDLAKANNVVLIENVNTAGGGCLRYLVAGLLIFGYGLVAVAIVCSTIENTQSIPTGTAIKNMFFALAAVSCPLWIKPAAKGLQKMIKQLFIKSRKQEAEISAVGPKAPPAQGVQVETGPFANANVVKLHLPDEPNIEWISKTLCQQPTISISIVQRKCKFGFARASRVVDALKSAGLIAQEHETIYRWTEKAK